MPLAHRLRPYQAQVGRAVLESIRGRRGLTFTVEISRQGGKNELSAQLELLLLTLNMAKGGDLVKASPTFHPQALISLGRLKDSLDQAGLGGFWVSEQGYAIRLGRARQLFLSADESSNVVGHTAHLLLEIDEAQDVSKDKFAKDFRPMGSSTNVTTVLYGTPWDDFTLLEEMKQLNLELERKDGIRRHFRYDWQEVARYNPDYLAYVEGERARLGEGHPLFLTQYCLSPLGRGGRFLSPVQLEQMRGDQPRIHRAAGGIYVAGIDVAGEDEEVEDAALRRLKPLRDSTVITIAELDFSTCNKVLRSPCIRIVEHYWRTGVKHASLYPQLLDLLKNVWRCKAVVVDATGIGGGVAQYLLGLLGEGTVRPYVFTAPSKSKLAFGLLAAVNAGRLKTYAQDDSQEAREFWFQMEHARSALRPNQTMNFFVDPREGHDDFLMSVALAVEAAEGSEPREARGRLRNEGARK
ncbi:MAG: hypothetical protein Q8P59_03025 [Dehalococcoidia bacterium]|nr:hypothetical protein [Dehalococcoidia bacterium]